MLYGERAKNIFIKYIGRIMEFLSTKFNEARDIEFGQLKSSMQLMMKIISNIKTNIIDDIHRDYMEDFVSTMYEYSLSLKEREQTSGKIISSLNEKINNLST